MTRMNGIHIQKSSISNFEGMTPCLAPEVPQNAHLRIKEDTTCCHKGRDVVYLREGKSIPAADLHKTQGARQLQMEVVEAELPQVSAPLRGKLLAIAAPSEAGILVHQARTLRNMVHGAQHYAGFIGEDPAAALVEQAVAERLAAGPEGRRRMDAAARLIQAAPGLNPSVALRRAPDYAIVLAALHPGPGLPTEHIRRQAADIVRHAIRTGMIDRPDWTRRIAGAAALAHASPALSGADALRFGQVFKVMESRGIEPGRALPLIAALGSERVTRVSGATLVEAASLMPGGSIGACEALRLVSGTVYHELKKELTPGRAAQLALHMETIMDKHQLHEELRLGSKLKPVIINVVKRFKAVADCTPERACADYGFETHVERCANEAMRARSSQPFADRKQAGIPASVTQFHGSLATSSASGRSQLADPRNVPRPAKRESKTGN